MHQCEKPETPPDRDAYAGVPAPEDKFQSTIYILRAADRVKIGFAKDLLQRIKDIQACSPVQLTLVATIPGGLRLEQALHKALSDCRQHGEWFDWCMEIELLVALAREANWEAIAHFAFDDRINAAV